MLYVIYAECSLCLLSFMLNATYAECQYTEFRDPECCYGECCGASFIPCLWHGAIDV